MYANIALMSPPYTTLRYVFPEWLPETIWEPCLRVAVVLNNKIIRSGIILSLVSDNLDLPKDIQIKPILWPLERTALFSKKYLSMIQQLALKQAIQPGKILANVLPTGLKTTKIQLRLFADKDKPEYILLKTLNNKNVHELKKLGKFWEKNKLECLSYKEDAASSELCVLHKEPPWNIRHTANRQKLLLDFLFKNGATSKRILLKTFGHTYNVVLCNLIKAGFISLIKNYNEEPIYNKLLPTMDTCLNFSPEQKKAIERIETSIIKNLNDVFLLFGITGSGKTAVYIETIRICLKEQKSILVLAPEVALVHKLKQDISTNFPNILCYIFHGYQSSQQKEYIFKKAATTKQPLIIIGTRSALFLPISTLGAIILDEEHDASFKQNERILYHAKDIAWFYAKEHKAIVVLGSATPDIKTFYATQLSKITPVYLPNRIGNSHLPQIKLIDIKKNISKETAFSAESIAMLKETVHKGEQAIILLNRRGYAPIMYCIDCGSTASCPCCAISLTYHKKKEALICHYCGYIVPFPSPCMSCKSIHFYPIGHGTEHIEETLSGIFPYEKIFRFDHDTTKKIGQTEKILTAFANNEAKILVGTQMLSKGHHFPNVTLVLIANGDLGLNIPDYKAAEKTFQLLTQSAGRAGRGDKPGTVFIQTCDTSHYCWKFIQQHDYKGFYDHEIMLRKKWQYPPFTHLALLRLSYPIIWKDGPLWLEKIQSIIHNHAYRYKVIIRGPALSPISIVKNRKRFQWLLKGENWQYIRGIFSQVQMLKLPKYIKVSLDLDPVDML